MIYISICDDREEDILTLKKYVRYYLKQMNLKFKLDCFLSGKDLLLSARTYDIYFLDIEMEEDINGISLGKIIKEKNITAKIIYVTGYNDYYRDAFQIHAYMYLVKPIKPSEIKTTLEDCINYINNRNDSKDIMVFNIGGESVQIDTLKIIYFEARDRKIRIVTESGEIYIRGTLKNILQEVKQYHFGMPHNAYIVNFIYIQKIEGYNLKMKNNDIVTVSQKKMVEFKNEYFEFLQQAFHIIR